jgi:superfamily I DNA/RNA helicase
MLSLETSEEREESGDRVVLTALHGAKGLEFPVCFLIGVE